VSSAPTSAIAEHRSARRVPLPQKLRSELAVLGRHFRTHGIRVFIFGSVARTWPNAAPTSDLDLGFEWISANPHPEITERELARRVSELPTVRPIDLVNFSTTSSRFRTCACEHTIDLGNE
jgi:predicted nucleotidyltransferase